MCQYAGNKPNGLDFRDQPASRKPVFFSCLVNSVDINLLLDTALTKQEEVVSPVPFPF